MLSSYFYALALWCVLGYWLLERRAAGVCGPAVRPGLPGYIALFASSRLFFLAMGAAALTLTKGAGLAADAMAFAAVAVVERRTPSPRGSLLLTGLYLFNPVIPLCVGTGNVVMAVSALLLFTALYAAASWLRRRVDVKELFLPLNLTTGGVYLLAYYVIAGRTDGGQPSTLLWVAGALCLVFAAVFAVHCLRKESAPAASAQAQMLRPAWRLRAQAVFGRTDFLAMLGLTLLGACVIFFRLGSTQAPETGMTVGQNTTNKEVALTLPQGSFAGKVYLFTGSLSQCSISYFTYDDQAESWESLLTGDENSAFTWNAVELDGNFDNLGIVFNDSLAYVNEIVIVDAQGRPVLPDNAASYPFLFDEQDCFPGLVTYYDGTMFDEIYHGRTAFEFLHLLPVYEWTHPPLGKILIGIGIRLFGMTPFGWRCIPALFGVLTIPLTYLLAWRLRRRTRTAVLSCVLLLTSCMHTTLSRIATLDVIIGFFVLLMFYCMLRYLQDKDDGLRRSAWLSLVACGVATGLAVATKWTGCYAALGIAAMFFAGTAPSYVRRWKQPGVPADAGKLLALCVASFLAVPAAIYVLSYIPYVRCGGGENVLELAIRNARDMLSYHVGVTQTHPYQSEWYEWLVGRRPLLDAVAVRQDGKRIVVSTAGSPVVLLGGLAAFACQLRAWRLRGDKSGAVLCTAYLSMLLPWLLVHRTVFIYQYYPCILLLSLMLGDGLAQGTRKRAAVVIGLSVLFFLCCYPVLTGAIAVWPDYADRFLEWLPTWCFG